MKKIVFAILIIFLLSLTNVFALGMLSSGTNTLITGTVYKHKIYPGNEVPFARVDVRCGSSSASIVANHKGDFAVGFDKSTCRVGSTFSVMATSPDGSLFGELTTSCTAGSKCKDIVCHVSNAAPVLQGDGNEIPEFSGITAALAVVGAGVAFIFLRRK